MKAKAKRIRPNLRKVTQWTKQHLHDTGLLTDFIDPPFTPEEDAQARYMASAITKQFAPTEAEIAKVGRSKAEANAARRRHLTYVYLYRMLAQGVINFYESMAAQKVTPKPAPVDRPIVATEEAPLPKQLEGYKYERKEEQ